MPQELFDAHCHVQDSRYGSRTDAIIGRALDAGVIQMICCSTGESDWDRVKALSRKHRSVIPAFGIHPWYLHDRTRTWQTRLRDFLSRVPDASVGEIGIDGASDIPYEDQETVLRAQLRIAIGMNRVVSIHCRKGWDRLLKIVGEEGLPSAGGLVHAFGGSVEIMHDLAGKGFYLSFSGSITYPNHKRTRFACREAPRDRILIETDSPDIVPSGVDAPLNEPATLPTIAQAAAEIREESSHAIMEQTRKNALRLFALGKDHS